MPRYKKFDGKRYELFESRVSKTSANIVAQRFRHKGASVRITYHRPSNSYNVWTRGPRGFWI